MHSFRTPMDDLATLTRNTVRCGDLEPFVVAANPTSVQRAAFAALGVRNADL